MNQNNIPAELRALTQWVCWSLEQRPGQPKPTKVPKNALGNAATTRPEDWMTFDAAVALAAEKKLSGIGFVFTKDDPYVGVDLDGLLDPKTLAMTPAAQDIVQSLAPAYTEISQSGKGIHIIVRGTLPAGARRKGPIEVYSEGRYFAITGNILAGSVATVPDRTEALGDFHRKYLSGADDTAPTATTPAAPTSDAVTAVLAKVDASPDARFFTTLYEFGETRPGKSASESDMAMAAMLAKYTRSADLIEAVMKASALRRPKWNEARPIPGRKDGTILRRVIAAALRQVPERKHESLIGDHARSLADILKNGMPRPPAVVVQDLAWRGRITLVAASEGLGKSTLFAEAAAAVTLGRPYLGIDPTPRGTVLWVLVEEHVGDVSIRAMTYGNYIIPDAEAQRAHPHTAMMRALVRAGFRRLNFLDRPVEALAQLKAEVLLVKPTLVVIDTLHAFAGPQIERTSAADDWQAVMTTFDAIARGPGEPAVLMAAQAVKSTGDYRDSSAIGHGVDVVLTLRRFKGEGEDGPTRELVVKKARWTVRATSYQRQGTALVRLGADVIATKKEAERQSKKTTKSTGDEAKVLEVIRQRAHINAEDLRAAAGGGVRIDKIARQLEAQGRIINTSKGRAVEWEIAPPSAAVLDPNAVATASGATM